MTSELRDLSPTQEAFDTTSDNGEIVRNPEDVVRFYSRVALIYEAWGKLVDGRVRRQMLALAAVSDGDAVLEVGCGTGTQLEQLARMNPTGLTVGADLARGMVARAGRRLRGAELPDVQLHQADLRRLPFPDDTFDVVTGSYVFDILPRAQIAEGLAEIYRVLRPGGRVIIASSTLAERRLHRLPELLYGTGLPFTGNCRAIAISPDLLDAGFCDISRTYTSQWLLPSEILRGVVAPVPFSSAA